MFKIGVLCGSTTTVELFHNAALRLSVGAGGLSSRDFPYFIRDVFKTLFSTDESNKSSIDTC